MSDGVSLLTWVLGDPDKGGAIDGGPEWSVGDPGEGMPIVGDPGGGDPFVGKPGDGAVGEAGVAVPSDRNDVENSCMKR
jgi:hypothetical protein